MSRLRETKKQGLREFFLRKVREEGQTVFSATYQEIAAMSGVSLGTVVKGLRVLEQEGFLKIRRGPSRRVPNSYAVLLSGEHPGRTFGEELEEQKRVRRALEQELEVLRRHLVAYEGLVEGALVAEELPGDLQLLIVPRNAYRHLKDLKEEEERQIRRLLDRRGIGAGLRRLRRDPSRDAVAAFEARLRRRLEGAVVVRPRLRAVLADVAEELLGLSCAEDLPAALERAEARYEAALLQLGAETAGTGEETVRDPSSLSA